MADGVIRNVLERLTDELPDEPRIVFVACIADGMTPEQFAELFELGGVDGFDQDEAGGESDERGEIALCFLAA
jgi:hypothetical protein